MNFKLIALTLMLGSTIALGACESPEPGTDLEEPGTDLEEPIEEPVEPEGE